MRIEIRKILSLATDRATCTLLILDETVRILLDCGIDRSLDFSPYLRPEVQAELKKINLALISHSALQYSGAYGFLIEELSLNPKLFYTTQPIMRYSPLNIHEEILNVRHPTYSKKIFNKMYSHYEEMQMVKPFQKKQVDISEHASPSSMEMLDEDEEVMNIRLFRRSIIFVCYPGGGSLGNIAWRITFGLISVVYLVQYTNYALHHIAGLDLMALKGQRVHVLITDCYPQIQEATLKKEELYATLKEVLLRFYDHHHLDPSKPKPISSQNEPRLLVTCYPNETLIEVMIVLRKILLELQESRTETIGVGHVSSRYLQLVKSQSEYFSTDFKLVMEKFEEKFKENFRENFVYERSIAQRINISTLGAVDGVFNGTLRGNVQVFHVGRSAQLREKVSQQTAIGNLNRLTLFKEEEIKLLRVSSKMEIEPDEQEQPNEEEEDLTFLKEELEEEKELLNEKQLLVGQYISMIEFPHFVRSVIKEEDQEVDEYGLRHHSRVEARDRKNIHQLAEAQLEQTLKISNIEIMNIVFKLSQEKMPLEKGGWKCSERELQKTGFDSSVKILKLLNPKDIILINAPPQSPLVKAYTRDLSAKIYELHANRGIFLQHDNELMEYRVNYIPNLKRVQRVHGVIERVNGNLHIHLDRVDEAEIFQFRLEKFYKMAKSQMSCVFTGDGILIEGVHLSRKTDEIILQGDYSENFFKVRRLLYSFLGIT